MALPPSLPRPPAPQVQRAGSLGPLRTFIRDSGLGRHHPSREAHPCRLLQGADPVSRLSSRSTVLSPVMPGSPPSLRVSRLPHCTPARAPPAGLVPQRPHFLLVPLWPLVSGDGAQCR